MHVRDPDVHGSDELAEEPGILGQTGKDGQGQAAEVSCLSLEQAERAGGMLAALAISQRHHDCRFP